MITAIINIGGFVKHMPIDINVVRYGLLRVAVPRLLADLAYGEPSEDNLLKMIEFQLVKYDEVNRLAYFDHGRWV